MAGIAHRRIAELPFAIVDLETTGLYAGGDRIVEIAVVRAEPNQKPALVLDTLVNPRRPVSATEIHGITDAEVADAPTFDELAGNVLHGIAGAVFASYNVYFDARFVQSELKMVGVREFPPHLCLMYMGLGKRQVASAARLKPRTGERRPAIGLPHVERHELVGEYWDALTAALSDLAVTPDEVHYLRTKQAALSLTENELRWLHARAFAGILADMCQDKAVTADEVWALSSVTSALRALGWAPGDMATDIAGGAFA